MSSEYVNVSLKEQVPEHILRTVDEFSSESDNEEGSEHADEFEDVDMDHGEEFETHGNSGWADAMAKILRTNASKDQQNIVLAKAKKISDVVKKENNSDLGFEIEGEIKEEKPDLKEVKKENTAEEKRHSRLKRREWRLKGRIKPSILEKNRERTLSKIATKGIVQLFNTVRNHQKQLDKKLNAAGTERKREKVLNSVNKQTFLDMLMGSKNINKPSEDAVEKEIKEEEKGTWEVLRDDFMMEGNLKDWDKKVSSRD
ncbi:hypothetical protein R5R35_001892 [Gryllus longicercus]|uniref:RRP15-like protein n=1 Tax=Gryllus longicercus TaxID=2509291 RepID=A0AAN9VNT0_9ORTH